MLSCSFKQTKELYSTYDYLRHSRLLAGSRFRALSIFPYCCLPKELGPCLSSYVADHPLRPAKDRWLGEPLPHQLPNPAQAHQATDYAFLISKVYLDCLVDSCVLLTRSPLEPFKKVHVRLACIKLEASVYSEPRSNSSKINKPI